MILINTDKIFENAINTQNVETTEKILLCSDNIQGLITTYAQNQEIEKLQILSQQFKSKGLIKSISTYIEKNQNYKKRITENESSKVTLTHKGNKKHNELKHLSGSSFPIKPLNKEALVRNKSL